jgi:hypothetical protein
VHGFTTLSILQPFALPAFDGDGCAFPICHLASVPLIIPFALIAR